ncbi:MAG: hypothetical protein EOM22_13990 [Gammaproteobacteria bacterium]|nr:hypothetical protein [Gammaproteobacteria bacterium]
MKHMKPRSTAVTLTRVLALGVVAGAGSLGGALHAAEPELGCLPGGEVFGLFSPDAVKVRTTAYMTPFGTLNANIVLGDAPSGPVAIAAIDLAERFGEFLTAIAATSSIPIAIQASRVPEKYLEEKTIILCGGPAENPLVRRLVEEGRSVVDWENAEVGHIEVVEQAFGGPGRAVILGGANPRASVYAINAFTEFFKHLAGASLALARMLDAERQLQRPDIAGAGDSFERMLDGLRIDGSAKFHVPIRNPSPDFEQQLKDEVKLAQQVAQLLRSEPTPEEARTAFYDLAERCTDCHRRYLSFDFNATNRVQYLFSQYPNRQIGSDWAMAD